MSNPTTTQLRRLGQLLDDHHLVVALTSMLSEYAIRHGSEDLLDHMKGFIHHVQESREKFDEVINKAALERLEYDLKEH